MRKTGVCVDPVDGIVECRVCRRRWSPMTMEGKWLENPFHCPEGCEGKDQEGHAHEWVVFSTALADVCLLVQCVDCGMVGIVPDPSEKEWSDAFHAPSRPYLARRLQGRPQGKASPHVERKGGQDND